MWEYTAKEVAAAVLGSIGGIGGLITLINVITARLDKRRERRSAERQLDVSHSVDLRRVMLEEEKVDEGIWEAVAKEKQAQIIELKNDIHELKIKIQDVRKIFAELDILFINFRVAQVPDEVVELLVNKSTRARAKIAEGRDALS